MKSIDNKKYCMLLAVLFLVIFFSPIRILAADIYVNAVTGNDTTGDGSQGNPWKTITKALNSVLTSGNTINVAPGTYNKTLGEVFPLSIKNGVSLKGSGVDKTILDCQKMANPAVICSMISDTGTVVSGFTIKNADNTIFHQSPFGGGIYCRKSAVTISNCDIIDNQADFGGGIYFYQDSSTITNCKIINNKSIYSGGGIETFINCRPTINNCIISKNTNIREFGGGVDVSSSLVKLTNCNIVENTSKYGGAIACYYGSAKITNCTIANNKGFSNGGAISLANSNSTQLVNTILWGDSTNSEPNEIEQYSGSSIIKLDYSDFNPAYVKLDYGGGNNICVNPLFADNYHLSDSSLCVDAGTNDKTTFPYLPNNDIDGDTRPFGTAYDIGSDELASQCIDNDKDGFYGQEGCGTPIDCKDDDSTIYPGATEICDGKDNDCDGLIDEEVLKTYYRDLDGDGYGDINNDTTACSPPLGYLTDSTDCNDSDANTNPGIIEICDGIDNNCDGYIDEGFDKDNDGYTTCQGDCDDNNPKVNPGAVEVCNDGIDNDCNGEDSVTPSVISITAPTAPVQVGTSITATGVFTDPNANDTHTITWDWNDGSTTARVLLVGTRTVQDSHAYNQAGVYIIKLTVSDGTECGSDTKIYEYIVVYDPSSGFVTGGGWINSPAGAYMANPSMIGKANFGFNSKYKKGANVPDGQTEFQFKAGDLDFHSSSYEWLVVAGAKAQYKGIGTINGSGQYKFILTAIDANVNDNDSFTIDRFRIKIWSENGGGENVIYDNGRGAGINDDNATTEISSGSIIVHK